MEGAHRRVLRSHGLVDTPRIAWVAGSTGLVGRALVDALVADPAYAEVVCFARRAVAASEPKVRSHLVDFGALTAPAEARVAVAFCCLGTTIRSAGSREAFRKVDFDYVVAFARLALASSVGTFVVVTSAGSDAGSPFFYNRVKGEVERELSSLGLPRLVVARPSLLLGDRGEFRLGERLAAPFSRLLPDSIRGIEADVVARALVRLAEGPGIGVQIATSAELQRLGRRHP